jgi:probable HAF family extracellular repeat protein
MHVCFGVRNFACTFVIAIAATASAQAVQYQITSLPSPGTGPVVQAFGINNAGQVVGSTASASGQQAFLYSAGAYSFLSGPTGALGASATGIADNGKIAGSYYDTQSVDPVTGAITPGPSHAFVLSGGSYTVFDAPNATFTQARGISPDGRYVAGYSTSANNQSSAFVYDTSNSNFINLNRPNSINSFAQGINAAGVVVGSDFLTQPGSATQRVGFTYDINTGQRNDFAFAGYTRTAFRGINNNGVIAGWLQKSDASGNVVSVGFVGSPTAYDVITVPGATDTFVQGINDAGVISGYYNLGNQAIGFIATPVPEPQSLALMLGGVVALVTLGRRLQTSRAKV